MSTTTIALDVAAVVRAASTSADVFAADLTPDELHESFLAYSKILHPDRGGDPALMAKLSAFYTERSKVATAAPVTLGRWVVTAPLHRGAIADLYLAASVKDGQAAVVKVARVPRDNDLLKREYDALLAARKGADRLNVYTPEPLDTFLASGRRANVFSRESRCFSLESIRAQYSSGVDFRHVVWMGNRLLSTLGFLHSANVVHGAVVPSHLLYRPDDHGLVLVDFTCAGHDLKVPYLVKRFTDHYPLEISTAKRAVTPSTDLFMAMAALRYAAGGTANIPNRFRALFDWCLLESAKARPTSAWVVQERWQQLAQDEYGKPTWVPFVMPVN